MISFHSYSTYYKVYICILCIITQRQTKPPINSNHAILSSDCQTPTLYQGSAHHCEKDCNSNIMRLLHPSQAIYYCNQSGLAIVPDLTIFVFSITIFGLILRRTLVRFSLLREIYLYNLMSLTF